MFTREGLMGVVRKIEDHVNVQLGQRAAKEAIETLLRRLAEEVPEAQLGKAVETALFTLERYIKFVKSNVEY